MNTDCWFARMNSQRIRSLTRLLTDFGLVSGERIKEAIDEHAPELDDDDTTDPDGTTPGLITGNQLTRIVQTHSILDSGLRRVVELPDGRADNAIYLVNEDRRGAREDVEIDLGTGRFFGGDFIVGWSSGSSVFGWFGGHDDDTPGDLRSLHGLFGTMESDGSVYLDTVVSRDRHFLERFNSVRLDNAGTVNQFTMNLGIGQRNGYYYRTFDNTTVSYDTTVDSISINFTHTSSLPYPTTEDYDDIAVYGDRIFYLDDGNNRIEISDLEGNYLVEESLDLTDYANGAYVALAVIDTRIYLLANDTTSTPQHPEVIVLDREGALVSSEGFDPDTLASTAPTGSNSDGAGIALTEDRVVILAGVMANQTNVTFHDYAGTRQTDEDMTFEATSVKSDLTISEPDDRIYFNNRAGGTNEVEVYTIGGTRMSDEDFDYPSIVGSSVNHFDFDPHTKRYSMSLTPVLM